MKQHIFQSKHLETAKTSWTLPENGLLSFIAEYIHLYITDHLTRMDLTTIVFHLNIIILHACIEYLVCFNEYKPITSI